jgi:hypothetical protein
LLTGAKLIEQLEAHGGVMVVLHVEGGQKNPTHMAAMHDFDEFYAYLQANYELVAVQDRQGQQIEIWQRPRR